MYPIFDENYYMYDMPPLIYQRPPRRFYFQKTLQTALKGIQIANQMIPIIYQVKPLIDNTRNGVAIVKAMRHLDDIDVNEVVAEIKPIQKEEKQLLTHHEDKDLFENMV